MNKRILVWDLPVRLFHWILAASFFGAFLIPNLVGDESSWFALHMLLGATMGFMVLLRVVWGVVVSPSSDSVGVNISVGPSELVFVVVAIVVPTATAPTSVSATIDTAITVSLVFIITKLRGSRPIVRSGRRAGSLRLVPRRPFLRQSRRHHQG